MDKLRNNIDELFKFLPQRMVMNLLTLLAEAEEEQEDYRAELVNAGKKISAMEEDMVPLERQATNYFTLRQQVRGYFEACEEVGESDDAHIVNKRYDEAENLLQALKKAVEPCS